MPLGNEDPVRVTTGIKAVEHRRRDIVRLLGCMAVAVACGCDPSGIEITSVTAKWPRKPKLPLKLELRVGFKLTGASSSHIKSVKLRGTIAGVEFAKVSGVVQGSSITFKVEISLTKGRILEAVQNAIDERKLQGNITLEAVLDTWVGAVTVNNEWSGEI